jgi:hypothetical protein
MTFSRADGCIAFVDNGGRMFVAPETDDRYHALTSAGYELGNFSVPFSGTKMPVSDKALGRRYLELMQQDALIEAKKNAKKERDDLNRL